MTTPATDRGLEVVDVPLFGLTDVVVLPPGMFSMVAVGVLPTAGVAAPAGVLPPMDAATVVDDV